MCKKQNFKLYYKKEKFVKLLLLLLSHLPLPVLIYIPIFVVQVHKINIWWISIIIMLEWGAQPILCRFLFIEFLFFPYLFFFSSSFSLLWRSTCIRDTLLVPMKRKGNNNLLCCAIALSNTKKILTISNNIVYVDFNLEKLFYEHYTEYF